MKRLAFISGVLIISVLSVNLYSQEETTLSVSESWGVPGSTGNSVNIDMDNSIGVGGIQFVLEFDCTLLSADSVITTSRTSHMSLGYTIWSDSIKVLIYSASGDSILPDSLSILQIFFSADSQAVIGDSSLLNLKDCILSDPLAQPIPCETQDGWFHFIESTDVEEATAVAIPEVLTLKGNFPNPFIDYTEIKYVLPQKGKVEINIYNLAGQKVITLYQGIQDTGWQAVRWDGIMRTGIRVGPGVYFYRINWREKVVTKKMIVLLDGL